MKKPLLQKRWRRSIWIILLGVILLLIASNIYVEYSTNDAIFSDIQKVPEKPIALVLGTARTVNGLPNLFYIARMKAAAELYRARKIRHILVSGDHSRHDYDEPTAMKEDLIALGIPAERITLDYAGFRTLDSVVRAHSIFGQSSFIIVTQRFHGERAVFLARHNGLDAVVYCASDVPVFSGLKTYVREYLARVKAVLDVWVLRTKPKYLGEPVAIDLST